MIGFIGLGNLGSPIAANLLESGEALCVYNRTADKMKPFAEKGAATCNSVEELVAKCTVIFTLVSDDAAVNALMEAGLSNMPAGSIHVSLSTISPGTATLLEALHQEKGSTYIACPVIGRPEAARARALNFCIAGEPAAVEQIKPLLTSAGAVKVWEYGNKAANANVAKLSCNFMIAAAIESMAEGLALAQKSGVDPKTVMTMLQQTAFNCPIYVNYGNNIINSNYLPAGFSMMLGLKDVNLVLQQAEDTELQMPVATVVQQRMQNCIQQRLGDHDWTAIALDLLPDTTAASQ